MRFGLKVNQHQLQWTELLDRVRLGLKPRFVRVESSGYVVEVVYTVRTRSGKELRGVKALARHDLLNATLPEPGTPVVVLVLDDRYHLML